jgi:hypothetical protein
MTPKRGKNVNAKSKKSNSARLILPDDYQPEDPRVAQARAANAARKLRRQDNLRAGRDVNDGVS